MSEVAQSSFDSNTNIEKKFIDAKAYLQTASTKTGVNV